jgi:hypothetical protein
MSITLVSLHFPYQDLQLGVDLYIAGYRHSLFCMCLSQHSTILHRFTIPDITFSPKTKQFLKTAVPNQPYIEMATAETCPLTESHPPKPAAIKSFKHILPEFKHKLAYLRHNHDKHEPEYFAAVSSLSDSELTSFDESNLVAVRAGRVAYGVIIFGKVAIPAAPGKYVFVRWFAGGNDEDGDGKVEADEGEVEYKFHSIYTEEKEGDTDGTKIFRAIMGKEDELFFFSE